MKGDEEFDQQIKLTQEKKLSREIDYDDFILAGVQIKKDGDSFVMHQTLYTQNLDQIPPCSGFKALR